MAAMKAMKAMQTKKAMKAMKAKHAVAPAMKMAMKEKLTKTMKTKKAAMKNPMKAKKGDTYRVYWGPLQPYTGPLGGRWRGSVYAQWVCQG